MYSFKDLIGKDIKITDIFGDDGDSEITIKGTTDTETFILDLTAHIHWDRCGDMQGPDIDVYFTSQELPNED